MAKKLQFDPVLKATGFLSRRFGILGGLAIFAALAAVEGGEILKSFDDLTPTTGSGETITTASGLQITETLVGKGGSVPLPGYIVGINAVVSVGDRVIYDTTADKPIAFKLGQRPFQNVICEGVEEGIKGMKVGGKRRLDVPKALAPPGVDLPPGVPLTYEVELTEVLSGYF
jgi:FKBP-type peptidyl-prolyl cis-trans isomerase